MVDGGAECGVFLAMVIDLECIVSVINAEGRQRHHPVTAMDLYCTCTASQGRGSSDYSREGNSCQIVAH
jgi:hypothetical protein